MFPLFDILSPLLTKVFDLIPDPAKKAEAQLKLQQEIDANSQAILTQLAAVDRAQAETNTEEAKSSDKFVSRARPAAMWVCVFGLAWGTAIEPIIGTLCVLFHHSEMVAQLPPIDVHSLMTVLGYMLGYGGIRSWEKSKGIAS